MTHLWTGQLQNWKWRAMYHKLVKWKFKYNVLTL
uniref:Uncharacterized protein n=1 Tax=Anguilla anguilla TaxID=7936 RepID=A0A0E9TAT2_ANGAN